MERLMRDRRRARRRGASTGGFTLIEVLIALSVLALGVLSLAAMQLHAMRGGSSGRHSSYAASLAQTRMERLQRDRWTNLAPTGGWTAGVVQSNTVQADPNANEQSYTVSWRLADVEANWTRSIDVRVTWTEPTGRSRAITLSSMRYNREAL